jgi:phosphatidyl-myo-inositol dimannoside synthase
MLEPLLGKDMRVTGTLQGAPLVESPSIPRLLVVTNHFPPRVGGVERFVHDLVRHLPPDRVSVLAPRRAGCREFDAGQPYRVYRWGGTYLAPIPQAVDRVETLVRETGAEMVLFGHVVPLGWMGPWLRDRCGVSYAALTHGAEPLVARLPSASRLLRRVFAQAEVAFSVSRVMQELMRRAVPDGVPVALLPPGADAERFHPDVDPAPALDRFGLTGRPVVLSVSRLVRRKGQDVLIRAWPRVLRRFPEAALLLVGDGPQRGRLHRMVEHRGLEGSVIFAGSLRMSDPLLPSLYTAARVFAMPCRSRVLGFELEAFGIVYLEAAAAGRPAIAGDSGGAGEAVLHGETGLVVDGRAVEETAGAIIDLLEDEVRAKAMGLAGRARVEREFAWPRIIDRLGDVLSRRGVSDG